MKRTFDELVDALRDPTPPRAIASSRTASTSTSPTRSPAAPSTPRWRRCSSCRARRVRPDRASTRRRRARARLPRGARAPARVARQPPRAAAAAPCVRAPAASASGCSSAARIRCFALIERVTGFGFLEDVSEFLLAFEGMSEGFRERARGGARSSCSAPTPRSCSLRPRAASPSAHARDLLVAARGAPASRVVGVVANRVRCWPDAAPRLPSAGERDARRAELAEAFARQHGAAFPSARGRRGGARRARRLRCRGRARTPRRRRRSWTRLRCGGASCDAFRSCRATCTISTGWRASRDDVFDEDQEKA